VAAAEINSSFPSRIRFDVSVKRVLRWRDHTSTSVEINYTRFSALTSPQHKNKKMLKEYSEVTIEACYKWQSLRSFIANKGVN
jgi:hypothetical protein